jgi:hypothetical protein
MTHTHLIEAATPGALLHSRIAKADGVIYGVVMINARSSNGAHGRLYTSKALKQIAEMSEGLPAYMNHVPREQAFRPRDVREMIGSFKSVRFEESKSRVVGDLHVVEHHRPLVFGLAAALYDTVGISLVSRGAMRLQNDVEIIEDIIAVRSGDLVSDPATTRGLFEHRERPGSQEDAMQPDPHTRLRLGLLGQGPVDFRPTVEEMAEAAAREERRRERHEPADVPAGAHALLEAAISGRTAVNASDAHTRLRRAFRAGM